MLLLAFLNPATSEMYECLQKKRKGKGKTHNIKRAKQNTKLNTIPILILISTQTKFTKFLAVILWVVSYEK